MSPSRSPLRRSARRGRRAPPSRRFPRARLALLGTLLTLGLLLAMAGWPSRDARDARIPTRTPAAHDAALTLSAPSALPVPLCDASRGALADLGGAVGDASDRERTGSASLQSKLQAKSEKQAAKLAGKQAQLGKLQAELAAAQLALVVASQLDEDSAAALKAKEAALAKAAKKVAKKLKKMDELTALVEVLAGQLVALDASLEGTGDDDGGSASTSTPEASPPTGLAVPVILQQVLAAGAKGFAREDACATFGVPFAQGVLPQIAGRPALLAQGATASQFRTLAAWPDGSVQWALADVIADVPADGTTTGVTLVGGTGSSGGASLASQIGNTITLNTGALKATVLRDGFNLFDTVVVGGTNVVAPHQSGGIVGVTEDGLLMVPQPGSLSVTIEENGPARATVRADGTLYSQAGKEIIDFTCRITARALSTDLQVDFTLRNASLERPAHAVLRGLGLVVRALPGKATQATLARHDGQVGVSLAAGSTAWLHQAYSSAATTDVMGTGGGYLPAIPKLNATQLVEEGYQIVADGQQFWSLGDKTKFPAHGWVDLTGDQSGITLGARQMAYFWPAALQVWGTGNVSASLWPLSSTGPYTFCWRQHESRTVTFSFHKGPAVSPGLVAERLDAPVSGRAADYLQYDAAGVFPYRLLTTAQQKQAYALMGLDHTVAFKNDSLCVTRFLAAHNTGGSNNHDSIERRLGGEWLREGLGGQYLNGLDLALYKAEWQILRSDDFDHAADPGASNEKTVAHSKAFAGDLEHRYRDGLVLAYQLTGDMRLRDALLDEAEILASLPDNAQERSFYQTIRALAAVGRFTGSSKLRTELHDQLDGMLGPKLNVQTATSGFGWEAAPGSGARRYFVNGSQNGSEKPPGEFFVTRGFITASLGPIAYFSAADWLGPQDADAQAASLRLRDLAYYTRQELFPWFANPADRHLVYAWAVKLKQVVSWESADFHPILLGMAEAFRQTGDVAYLDKGVEQIQAFAAHDQGPYDSNLYVLDSRLDAQHFLATYRAWKLGIPLP